MKKQTKKKKKERKKGRREERNERIGHRDTLMSFSRNVLGTETIDKRRELERCEKAVQQERAKADSERGAEKRVE